MSDVLLILLLSLVTGSCLVIAHQWRKGRQRHENFQELRQQVVQLRLSKMLTHLGASLEDYTRIIPRPEIEKHVRNCKQCVEYETCDTCLRDGRVIFDMNFCPNYGSLTAHSRTIALNE